ATCPASPAPRSAAQPRSSPSRPTTRWRRSRREHAALLHHLAIGRQAAALAKVADEIPVHGGLVDAAGLRIGAAEREVDGAADLLVEQDRADRAVDPGIRSDADLAQPAGARTCR